MKRTFDIIISLLALLCLAPVLLLIAFMIRKKLGAPFLFRQIRPGLNEKPFEMIKFRSMKNAYDSKGNFLPDNERLTEFGLFLRNTSLDELPELINVLRGDMSLVGPRPLLVKYLPFYSEKERKRHLVRPGITGWSQINGRNNISWSKKFDLDVWYIENQSIWLDFKILFLTLHKVFTRDGVVPDAGDSIIDFDDERRILYDK